MSRRWRSMRTSRPRRWDPPWTPPAPPAPMLRARPTRLPQARRGRFFTVLPAVPAPPPQLLRPRRTAALPRARRGTFQPVVPTAVTAVWIPPQLGHRPSAGPRPRRGAITWSVPAPAAAQDLIVTSAGILPGWWSARLLSGVPVQRQKAESLEYVPFAVGTSLGDPTAYTVEAAFALTTAPTTEAETWAAASWVDAGLDVPPGTYVCQCLVGPGGAIELEAGTYVCYVRIHADPETPVRQAGLLNIY